MCCHLGVGLLAAGAAAVLLLVLPLVCWEALAPTACMRMRRSSSCTEVLALAAATLLLCARRLAASCFSTFCTDEARSNCPYPASC
jgi:hypothetical protein